jgi:hypothetical protein
MSRDLSERQSQLLFGVHRFSQGDGCRCWNKLRVSSGRLCTGTRAAGASGLDYKNWKLVVSLPTQSLRATIIWNIKPEICYRITTGRRTPSDSGVGIGYFLGKPSSFSAG